jgi:Raf kinase inhibitor-like YbhB/YbcL family protein
MKKLLLACCLATAACASPAPAKKMLAIDRPETRTDQLLIVSSPAFGHGGPIPLRYTAYGANETPPLAWSALPSGTISLALVVEDPDGGSPQPFVHWTVWNLPPGPGPIPQALAGAAQGKNGSGRTGWYGPHPPDAKPHHYHFELFALDTKLSLPADTDRDRLAAALNEHVLAKCELVGVFTKPGARRP